MKKQALALTSAAILGALSFSSNSALSKPQESASKDKTVEVKNLKKENLKGPKTTGEKVSATLGSEVARQVQKAFETAKDDKDFTFSEKFFVQAFQGTLNGDKPLLTEDEKQTVMVAFQEFQMNAQKKQAEKLKKEGDDFLTANKSKKGVISTKSGLQYRVIKEGKGEKPGENWEVSVHYKGTLINGEHFDASYEGDKPTDKDEAASFNVNHVIPGWTEALKLMKVGSTWELFIPSELAYGPTPYPGIPANSVLLFKVSLLSAKKPEEKKKDEAPLDAALKTAAAKNDANKKKAA